MPPRNSSAENIFSKLDNSPVAKAIAGSAARQVVHPLGVARGAYHTVKGAYEGLNFAARLTNPFDLLLSPPGEAAVAQLAQGVVAAGQSVNKMISDPRSAAKAAERGMKHWYAGLDPYATPQAGTMLGEVRRNIPIGLNQGELAFDGVSLFYGGAEAKMLASLAKGAEARFLAKGMSPGKAKYFAELYDGEGSHSLPKRSGLPSWLIDSPFFLYKPKGITNGDMYEIHYGVDTHYHGGKVPAKFDGGSWSGKREGWKKHGPVGRVWHGAPAPLKTVGGAVVVGVHAAGRDEEQFQ